MAVTAPTMTMETPEAMSAYSMAVLPLSLRRKRPSKPASADFACFNIVSPLPVTALRHVPHNSAVKCGINGSSAAGIG
jgi:hypothetical protein